MSAISMDTPAIDVHAHVGPYDRGDAALKDRFCSGGADAVVARGRAVGLARSVVSSIPAILPYGGDVLAGNDAALADVEAHDDLFLLAVLNPLVEKSFDQVSDLLSHEKCVGIKIHPTDHGYEIREHGDRLFAFAAKHEAVVLTHSGGRGSYPEDFVELADRYAPVRLVLAHMGNSDDGRLSRQVCALARCRSANMFVDTSSAASISAGLIEWAVGELGAERILLGSDSPLYHIACQKARIVYADIEDAAKQAILYDNAARLFVWQNA